MSPMLVFGFLIGYALVMLVDAGSWSVAVQAVKRVQRNNTLRLNDVSGQALSMDNDQMYKGTVFVGTPPVPFTVFFDTGSDILWLPKIGCTSSGPLAKYCHSGLELYDPAASRHAERTDKVLQVIYGTGSARGFYYKDYFAFGDSLRFKKPIKFGAADVMEFSDQGILGLPSLEDPEEYGTSIIHEAWRQKLLDAPIFTIYMKKCPNYEDCQESGVITFGALDKHNCDEDVNYVGISYDSSHWEFTASQFQIGRGRVSTPFKAISDSGSNTISAPVRVVEQLMRELGATPVEGGHIMDCDADATVILTINGHRYVIPSRNMLLNLHTGRCKVLFTGYDDEEDGWILGTPFTQVFCTVHNIKKRTIGFAKTKN